ncbi:GrpB family protein [Phytobacter ursingii]
MTGRRISIEQSDPTWPERYQKEALLLQRVLSDIPVAIHHIGSTAVPGLAAKPIIDILLEVPSLHLLDKYNDTLRQAGYTPRGEYGIPGRRYFVKGENQRTHHLHAFELGSQHTLRHLAFRNYLRQHSDIAQEYERVNARRQNTAETCLSATASLKMTSYSAMKRWRYKKNHIVSRADSGYR